jgi:hypothetical protein
MLCFAQNPANKPDGNDTQSQNKTNDARGTVREPQPITVNCNQSTGAVAEHDSKETPERNTSVQWSNWVLVGIAAITAGVIWLQTKATRDSVSKMQQSLGLMEQQRDEMQKAREIANKTLILQYRPRIIVRDAKADRFEWHETPCVADIVFDVVNAGGSKAYITEGEVSMRSGIEYRLGESKIRTGESRWIEPFTLEPGEKKKVTISLPTATEASPFWGNFLEGIKTPEDQVTRVWIHLVGYISYRDELGIFRRTGFDRELQPQSRTFYRWKDAEGEYED